MNPTLRTNLPASPRACSTHNTKPSLPAHPSRTHQQKKNATPAALAVFGTSLLSQLSQGAHFGQFGCHGLDELLISELWIENRELPCGTTHHTLEGTEIYWGHGSLCCLVLAQKGEQSAHLRRGLFRLAVCLERAEGSRSAYVYNRARRILCETLAVWRDCMGRAVYRGS
jgi:hypothetical protein